MAKIFVKKMRNVPLSRIAEIFVKKMRNVPLSRMTEIFTKKMRNGYLLFKTYDEHIPL